MYMTAFAWTLFAAFSGLTLSRVVTPQGTLVVHDNTPTQRNGVLIPDFRASGRLVNGPPSPEGAVMDSVS